LMAVKETGEALKYAKGGLNQDLECLKTAGILHAVEKKYDRNEKITMSVKFSLGENSTNYATEFQKLMKEDDFFGEFETFYPNAWCKSFCGGELAYTNMDNPCRGTDKTCNFPKNKNLKITHGNLELKKECCWRFGYRFELQESKDTNGFMIQVEEHAGLGKGQLLEAEMAKEVGVKVFRTYTNSSTALLRSQLGRVVKAVKDWYETGCANRDLENVFIGNAYNPYTKRPEYEKP